MKYQLKQPFISEGNYEIKRFLGELVGEPVYEDELTEEYYDSQIEFHNKIVEKLQVQRDKLVEFKQSSEYTPEPTESIGLAKNSLINNL